MKIIKRTFNGQRYTQLPFSDATLIARYLPLGRKRRLGYNTSLKFLRKKLIMMSINGDRTRVEKYIEKLDKKKTSINTLPLSHSLYWKAFHNIYDELND